MTGEAAVVLDGVDLGDVALPEVAEAAPAKKAKAKAGLKLVDKGKSAKAATAKTAKKAKSKKTATAKPVKAKSAKVVAKAAKKKTKKADEVERKPRKQRSAAKIDPHSEKGKALVKANLDEKGRDLPFKSGSMLRNLFIMGLKPGRTLKDIKAYCKSHGYGDGETFQLKTLRSLKSGDSSLRPYPTTHVWKLNEDGGLFHIHGVKRVACYERMARLDGR